MNEENLSKVLLDISDFIRSLNINKEISPGEKFDVFFMREDEGSLLLNREDSFHYLKSLGLLLTCVNEDLISRKEVERFLQDAILFAVDIQENRKDIQFETRIDQAIKTLRKSLLQKPRTFKIYYPVFGLSNDGLPIKVGNVLFCTFDEEHKSQFIKSIPITKDLKIIENNRKWFNKYIEDSEISNKPVCLIEIFSIDIEAAKNVALKELFITINIINFLGRQIPFNIHGNSNSSYLFLPGKKHREIVYSPIVEKGGKNYLGFGSSVVGPISDFSFKTLLTAEKHNSLELRRVNTLLEKKNKTLLERRLISAMSWAGQAFVEENKELAFLYNVISLEALILLDKKRNYLSERLSTRVAHLLGKDPAAIKEIKTKVKELYNTRSEIVHDGKYQVTNAELSMIVYFSQNCILRILRDEPFKRMNEKDLLDWFVNQSLGPKKEINKDL